MFMLPANTGSSETLASGFRESRLSSFQSTSVQIFIRVRELEVENSKFLIPEFANSIDLFM